MSRLRHLWPGLVGSLGGLVAAEAKLDYPHPLGTAQPLVPRGEALLLWLAVGLLGPPLVIAIERGRVLRRCLDLATLPARRPLTQLALLSAGVGAVIGCSAWSPRWFNDLALPWSMLSGPWVVSLLAGGLAGIAFFAFVAFPRLRRFFSWRVAAALGASFVTYSTCVDALR